MLSCAARVVSLALLLITSAASASAQPLDLKFAYVTSDRTTNYIAAIEPFVEAVNRDGRGLVAIEVSFSGALGDDARRQIDLVLNGTADMAFIIPGYSPERFTNSEIIELPGIVDTTREATLLYTDLVASGDLRGYEDLFVIGALASGPANIHTRSPVAGLADLKGLRIRSNNTAQAAALELLGAVPVNMPFSQVAGAIGAAELDGVAAQAVPLFEFGIGRVTANHFMLGVGANPLAIVMSRARFEALPVEVQQIIERYSGRWIADQFISHYDAKNDEVTQTLNGDPNRNVVLPSDADLAQAQEIFAADAARWLSSDPDNAALLTRAQTALTAIRAER